MSGAARTVVGLSDEELALIVKRGWRIYYSWTNSVQRQEHAVLHAMMAGVREHLRNRNDRRCTDTTLVEEYARAAISYHARNKLRKQKIVPQAPTNGQVADFVLRKMDELRERNTPEAQLFHRACESARRYFHLRDRTPVQVRAQVEQIFARRHTLEEERRMRDLAENPPVPF